MKVVIIGGVAGGASAAARLRRLDEQAEIVVLERTGYVSYANCGLPYYVGGVIRRKEALTLQTPQSFRERFRVEVRVHHEAVKIDPASQTVTVRRLDDGSVYEERYDELILSPGARAVKPELPGADLEQIFTLRTVEDTFRIHTYLQSHTPKRAVVIGGGFIGLEMAENLVHAGVQTTLLQRSGQVMPPLDLDMACFLHARLIKAGVDLRFHQAIRGFEMRGGQIVTLVEGKPPVEADLVVLAIGVEPDTDLARTAGLELGQKGSIVVNEQMQTSVPHIYAVGDAVQVRHFVTGRPALISLAGPANRQGRIAADNLTGRGSRYPGSQGSAVVQLFGLTAAATGLNEKTAKAQGIAYDKVVTYSASHATYYPGATNMTVKTLYDPATGKILGAQIVGVDGVDKRLDVLATAIRAGMTAQDLAELDLCYAPPYSSAKDPVNMAGFVIEDVRQGLVRQHHWHEVPALQNRADVTLLDVRTVEEYSEGHIPGAINIPLDDLRDRLGELDPKKPIYVNCFSGLRSYLACRILTQHGFDCSNLSGGWRFYANVVGQLHGADAPTHLCGVPIVED